MSHVHLNHYGKPNNERKMKKQAEIYLLCPKHVTLAHSSLKMGSGGEEGSSESSSGEADGSLSPQLNEHSRRSLPPELHLIRQAPASWLG